MPSRLTLMALAALAAALGSGLRARSRHRSARRQSPFERSGEATPPVHAGVTAMVVIAVALVLAAGAAAFLHVKRGREADALAARLTQGDPARGPRLALQYGCAGCHSIPGVRGPGGRVGPPLDDVGARVYLGGRLANTPDNLIRWIVNPREADPKTAMPVTGISKREARDVAAYLLTLR